MSEKLGVFSFQGKKPGPHLVILGAIHGNEVCGPTALARLKLELDLGLIELAAGRLTIVPVCNPAAYRAKARYIDANLNRIIAHWPQPEFPEHDYANQIVALIEGADVLLDIHSYPTGTIPYVFLDYPTPENTRFAQALGLQNAITGWPELYEANPDLTAGDTVQQAYLMGKPGVLVECGSHDDPASLAVAYQLVRCTLAYWGLMEGEDAPAADLTIWQVEHVWTRNRPGAFTQPWQNLDVVPAGEALIAFDDGETLRAPYDGVVILPDANAAEGREWIYFGCKQ